MNININNGITGDIVVLNQSSFNKNVDSLYLRMTPCFQNLIRQHTSGALDVSICALLEYGIEQIKRENIQITVNKCNKEVVIWVEKRITETQPFITTNYKASRSETRSVFVRMNKGLKNKLLELSKSKYSISALGIIKFSLDLLIKKQQSLIVKNEVIYDKN
ncbi:hypothetical protein [Enterobacter asburiae]